MRINVRRTAPDDYANQGMASISGWLSRTSADLISAVNDAQLDAGVKGAVAEIGVHHGRLFVLLSLLRSLDEDALAIDVFEHQELNVDGSGKGDRAVLEENLKRFGANRRVHVIARSSTDVTPSEILEGVGPVRLFSVDGGHTTEIALSDLQLAEHSLASGGVLIVDDVFNSTFPGVSAALGRYFLHGFGTLVPFAVSEEKTFLTDWAHGDGYRDFLSQRRSELYVRDEDFYGYSVAIFRNIPPWNERLQLGFARSNFYRSIRTLPGIEELRPVILKLLRR
jgi:hypothetical protein